MAIRVLVVEDSVTIRKRIVEILAGAPDVEVIGECGDGATAIAMCDELRPDVITLDMMLPTMTGLAATEWIMAHRPTPILIVSASTNRGELFRTYEALAAGAVDVLEKPLGNELDGAWEDKLVRTVKLVSRIRVITHVRGKLARAPTSVDSSRSITRFRAVVVGVSTGGPAALQTFLGGLGAQFPLPVVIVMHIAAPFSAAFADWLDGLSPLRVAFANHGMPLPAPRPGAGVILAPHDRHLVVRDGQLQLLDGPERHS
ncbi:MAG TPA: response regulator, partial [Polyangiaceae bacterium]|nr:response regulator [Polyangiaceae bacterium]